MTVDKLIKELSKFEDNKEIRIQVLYEEDNRKIIEYQYVSYYLDSKNKKIVLSEHWEGSSSKLLSTVKDLKDFLQWFKPNLEILVNDEKQFNVCDFEVFYKEPCNQYLGRWHTCKLCKYCNDCSDAFYYNPVITGCRKEIVVLRK